MIEHCKHCGIEITPSDMAYNAGYRHIEHGVHSAVFCHNVTDSVIPQDVYHTATPFSKNEIVHKLLSDI